MRSFIKITKPMMFALFLMGSACNAASEVPVAETPLTQSQTPALWHDGSKGGEYGIGEGWSIEFLPPIYETFTENIIVQEGIELIAIPATFEWIKEDSEILKKPKMVTKIVAIPAQYETITEEVMVIKASAEYYFTEARFNLDGTLKKPRTVKQRHIPAQMKNVSRRVVKVPAHTVERTVTAPLKVFERRNGYIRVVKTPARTIKRDVPDVTKTETRRREKHPLRFAIKNPDGDLAHIFDTFEGLTAFTESFNQPIGALSGKTFKLVKVNDYVLPKDPSHIKVRFQNGEVHLVGTCNSTWGNYELTGDSFTLSAMGNLGQHACTELFEMPDGRINERSAQTVDVIAEDEFIALGDISLKIQSNQNELHFTDLSGKTLIILEP